MDCEQTQPQRAAVLALQDLGTIWIQLQKNAYESASGELYINYDDFSQVAADCRDIVGPQTDTYFQASTFLRLARTEGAWVSVPTLLEYVAARSRQLQLRVQLGLFDSALSGSLSVPQLQHFLQQLCPAEAFRMRGTSLQDWALVASRRIWLTHCKRSRFLIKDLTASPLMDELMRGVQHLTDSAGRAPAGASLVDGDMGGASALQGWFAPANARRLRLGFAELDADGDGVLSQDDFLRFSDGTMTPFFIRRLYAQHCSPNPSARSPPQSSPTGEPTGGSHSSRGGSNGGCNGSSPPTQHLGPGPLPAGGPMGGRGEEAGMDFGGFVTFVAAWEERHLPGAIKYFFPLLDLQGRGYIDEMDLYTLFREVHQLWVELGQYSDLHPQDVLTEVMDLLRPTDPRRITPADFERCGAAATVIGLLADVNLFWEYENREALAQQAQQE